MEEVSLVAVEPNTIATYTGVGKKAYAAYYTHLWPNRDPRPYFDHHLDPGVVAREILDADNAHFLIQYGTEIIGILKLVVNATFGEIKSEEALLLEKIYLLDTYTARGIGTQVLNLVLQRARDMGKTTVWLDTMQKGPALSFYLKHGFEIVGEQDLALPGILEREKPMFVLQKEVRPEKD